LGHREILACGSGSDHTSLPLPPQPGCFVAKLSGYPMDTVGTRAGHCVRLVRADYGGDGVGHTRNGTPIDLFDRIGIQRDESASNMTLEATFGPDGAVCVAHTRLSDVLSMEDLLLRYPRLADHP
jgi:hypothetical protein